MRFRSAPYYREQPIPRKRKGEQERADAGKDAKIESLEERVAALEAKRKQTKEVNGGLQNSWPMHDD